MAFSRVVCAAALSAAVTVVASAGANERHFAYTYESAVLPRGARELEVWTTARGGRPKYFSEVDHRFEFEVGIAKNLQTAFYVNASGITEDKALEGRSSRFEYRGISSEWKYKLLDSVADPIGFTLYGELELAPNVVEIETKLIADKRAGNWLLATNLIATYEWLFESTQTTRRELETELDMAAAYFVAPHVGIGAESRTNAEISDGELEYVATGAGPAIAWADDSYWVALTALRQLPAPKRDPIGTRYVYTNNELYAVRLLFSFHL
jgi:hypothetical protein